MTRHTGALALAPAEPRQAPNPSRLRAELTAAGFLGPPCPGRTRVFYAGAALLSMVTFAGCAVHRKTAGPGDVTQTEPPIRMDGPFATPQFRQGRNTRPPRCPYCRTRLLDWRTLLDATERLTCTDCATEYPAWDWDWRDHGGWGRLFILVDDVFPGEAVPTPSLMQLLARSSDHPWRYFYVQD